MPDSAESSEFVNASIKNVERREGTRVTVETEVEMTSFAKFLGRTVDLSPGGLFVKTHETLDVGEQLSLEMWIPEAGEYLSVPGEVRWHQSPDQTDGTLNGYGLKFVDLDAETRDRLQAIVDRCRDDS